MSKILAVILAVIATVTMVGAVDMVKVYYANNDLHQTYSYRMVPAGLNSTEFEIAFANATPVFAGDINPDIRSSFPLQAYNLAQDEAGNSA